MYRFNIQTEDALSPLEGEVLFGLVRAKKPQVCVETGTHRGMSALYIGDALRENGGGVLYTYDIKDWGQLQNIESHDLQNYVKCGIIKGTESDKTDIDFLFIDGYHEKKEVQDEIKHFFPRLADNAIVVFHDAGEDNNFCQVNAAIDEYNLKTYRLCTENQLRIYYHDTKRYNKQDFVPYGSKHNKLY